MFARDYENAMMEIKLQNPLAVGAQVTVTIDYIGFIFSQPTAGVMVNYDYLEINGQKK